MKTIDMILKHPENDIVHQLKKGIWVIFVIYAVCYNFKSHNDGNDKKNSQFCGEIVYISYDPCHRWIQYIQCTYKAL